MTMVQYGSAQNGSLCGRLSTLHLMLVLYSAGIKIKTHLITQAAKSL